MTAKPRSGWGFLQQAVASVESRLDDILSEESDRPKKPNPPGHTKKRKGCEQVAAPPRLTSFQTPQIYLGVAAQPRSLMTASKSGWPGRWPRKTPVEPKVLYRFLEMSHRGSRQKMET